MLPELVASSGYFFLINSVSRLEYTLASKFIYLIKWRTCISHFVSVWWCNPRKMQGHFQELVATWVHLYVWLGRGLPCIKPIGHAIQALVAVSSELKTDSIYDIMGYITLHVHRGILGSKADIFSFAWVAPRPRDYWDQMLICWTINSTTSRKRGACDVTWIALRPEQRPRKHMGPDLNYIIVHMII